MDAPGVTRMSVQAFAEWVVVMTMKRRAPRGPLQKSRRPIVLLQKVVLFLFLFPFSHQGLMSPWKKIATLDLAFLANPMTKERALTRFQYHKWLSSTCNTKGYDPNVHPFLVNRNMAATNVSTSITQELTGLINGTVRIRTSDTNPNLNKYLVQVINTNGLVRISHLLICWTLTWG